MVIQYSAKWGAIHPSPENSKIFLTCPMDLEISPGQGVIIELPLTINFPIGVTAKLSLYNINNNPLLLLSEPDLVDNVKIFLMNLNAYSSIKISQFEPICKIDFYRESLTLSGINYNKETDTCTINSIDQLESSIVQIPPAQLQFENIYKKEPTD